MPNIEDQIGVNKPEYESHQISESALNDVRIIVDGICPKDANAIAVRTN